MKTLELTADRSGERIDSFIARRCPGISRSQARRLIDEGLVRAAGRIPRPSEKVRAGLLITVTVPPPATTNIEPEDIPITIIYQDDDILVVDKPPGLTVHPAPGHPSGTLVNALLAISPRLAGTENRLRPGIVHRLDKDTSGLLVVARNERALRALQRQLKDRAVQKTYLALVKGVPSPREGRIDAPIGRDPRNRKKMAIVSGGREAVTEYKVKEVLRDGAFSLLEVRPITGRTHQIRVHLAAIGHPVAGDAVYGGKSEIAPRQFLHAWRLAFHTLLGNRLVEFESPLPPDLRAALAALRG